MFLPFFLIAAVDSQPYPTCCLPGYPVYVCILTATPYRKVNTPSQYDRYWHDTVDTVAYAYVTVWSQISVFFGMCPARSIEILEQCTGTSSTRLYRAL